MYMIQGACSIVTTYTVQVEEEMRELLLAMEQQKAASATKVRQLATILQEMQAPGLH